MLNVSSNTSLNTALTVVLKINKFLNKGSINIPTFVNTVIASFTMVTVTGVNKGTASTGLVLTKVTIDTMYSTFSGFIVCVAGSGGTTARMVG